MNNWQFSSNVLLYATCNSFLALLALMLWVCVCVWNSLPSYIRTFSLANENISLYQLVDRGK